MDAAPVSFSSELARHPSVSSASPIVVDPPPDTRSRPEQPEPHIIIACPVRYGDKRCDAVLRDDTFVRHVILGHVKRVQKDVAANKPIPDIMWGTRPIDWKTVGHLRSQLRQAADRDIATLRMDPKNVARNTADPERPNILTDPLPPLPPPQKPYNVSCHVIRPYTEGGPGPLVQDLDDSIKAQPRERRYLGRRDPNAPFHPRAFGVPASWKSSSIFPPRPYEPEVVEDVEEVPEEPEVVEDAPEPVEEPTEAIQMEELDSDGSDYTPRAARLSPKDRRRTRSTRSNSNIVPLPSTLTPEEDANTLRPTTVALQFDLPISEPKVTDGVTISHRKLILEETVHPVDYIAAARLFEAEEAAKTEAAYKLRREESVLDFERRAASEIPYITSLKRRRPTEEELEAAAHLYASRKGEGFEYTAAKLEYIRASEVFIKEIEREGGWVS